MFACCTTSQRLMITVMCRFQDGAATANNPAALALAEARALWPDTPVDVLVSIGSGDTPPARRERSVSTYLETGNVLIESATDTQRIAAALATLAPLVPGLRYFRCAAASGPDATSGTILTKQALWPRHVWAGSAARQWTCACWPLQGCKAAHHSRARVFVHTNQGQ